MYRRDLLKQTGATAATIAAPAFIGPITLGSSETLTKLATANGTQIQSYGDGNPSFVIPYETDSDRADLKEWTTSQDGGRIIRDLETVGMLVVSVPWEAAGSTDTVWPSTLVRWVRRPRVRHLRGREHDSVAARTDQDAR